MPTAKQTNDTAATLWGIHARPQDWRHLGGLFRNRCIVPRWTKMVILSPSSKGESANHTAND